MNRIAAYLSKNIIGEASVNEITLNNFSYDNSIIYEKPSVVIFPRHTDDIRKTAKFCNQLAERGRPIDIVARGYGNSHTGASITDGVLVNIPKYLNRMLDFDEESSVIHIQSGINLNKINNLMQKDNLQLPLNIHGNNHTLGGIISDGLVYPFSSKNDTLFKMIDQLEIVLADGNLLQTKKLSKRELNKKIGQANKEAEIYRKIDRLIEENQDLINSISKSQMNNYGYSNISKVKQKDGSFDLSPLFVGSQGTLGIVSEAIVKLEKKPTKSITGIISCTNFDNAMDLCDNLLKLNPIEFNIFDARLFDLALAQGNFFEYHQTLQKDSKEKIKFMFYFELSAGSKISEKTKIKKINSIANNFNSNVLFDEKYKIDSINDLSNMFDFNEIRKPKNHLVKGVKIARVEWRQMLDKMTEIEKFANQPIPFYGSVLTEIVNFHTNFDLLQVSQKQTALRTIELFRKMTESLKGTFCASGGEGQLKNLFMQKHQDPELVKLYSEIKQIFDPNNIFNSNVKRPIDIRQIAGKIRNENINRYYQN